VAAREARRGVLRAWGCCVPLLLLCGAYVLRCVCEGLLFDRAASLQALHPNCNGVRGGSRDGHAAPHTTHDDAPFRGSSHQQRLPLCGGRHKNDAMAVRKRLLAPHTLDKLRRHSSSAPPRLRLPSPAVTAGRLKPATDGSYYARDDALCGTCLDPASNSKCCLPYSVLLPQMPRRCADNRHSAQRARELLVPQWLPRIKRTDRLT
jgi:hypothetical protein